MGSEAEKESSYTPKLPLPLFSASHAHIQIQSPERSGTLTPPLHASASVPFRWEEQPGKPKPCTTLATFLSNSNDFVPKCLELPPRLLLLELDDKNITKLPSPTTVFEGPYMGSSTMPRTHRSSSFRMASECYGSFRGGSCSPEMVQLGAMPMVVSKTGYNKNKEKERGFLGSWTRRALGLKARREVGGNSYVFPSYGDRDSESSRELREEISSPTTTSVKITRIRRVGSFPGVSHPKSHFWVSIYEGIKQVVAVPWSNKREKKDGYGFMG